MHSDFLAATFSIVFRGLLFFHGATETTKEHVITIDAPVHQARLIVEAREERLLRGDQVTFSLPVGPANTDASYDTRVPNLRDYIVTGGYPSDVTDETPRNPGRALIVLPKGTLSADGVFTTPAKFTKRDGTADVRCMAEKVTLRTDTTSGVTINITGPERASPLSFTVAANSKVIIVNSPGHPTGLHFHEYERLLDNDSRLGSVTLVPESRCNEDGSYAAAPKNDVPIGSNAVQRSEVLGLPDGDCGPIDP